jgi:hypothetical protein
MILHNIMHDIAHMMHMMHDITQYHASYCPIDCSS